MTIAEKIELALISIIGMSLWFFASELPHRISIGQLLLGMSAFLLFQSLIRDLWLLARKTGMPPAGLQRKIQCMCAESTIGMTGVIFGIILLGVGIDYSVTIPNWGWSILVMVMMTIGLMIKDYVMEWNPFRIYKDLDHINIVFTWKK